METPADAKFDRTIEAFKKSDERLAFERELVGVPLNVMQRALKTPNEVEFVDCFPISREGGHQLVI